MRKHYLIRFVTGSVLAVIPVMIMTVSKITAGQAPVSPAAAPNLPKTAPSGTPAQVVDLMTPEGSAAFGAQWKTMEAKIVDAAPIPNAMPGYTTTYDILPHASDLGFDDSSWPIIGAKGLAERRGGGKVSFLWYRATLIMPAKIGDFDTSGATAVFNAIVDDYGEIWVNGELPRRVGYPSPATIQGYNMPNRVVLTDAVKPGDKFLIAVFAINGPISVAPENFVFFHKAVIEFFR
jgi:gluconolactonase